MCKLKGLFGYIGFDPAGNDTYNKKFMIHTANGQELFCVDN
jgi:hypothetical protein